MLSKTKLYTSVGLILSAVVYSQSPADNANLYHIPIGSPGFQHNHSAADVTFDQHSFFLKNERIMLFSGEFHPWRSPSGPVLWRDVLEKMKVCSISLLSNSYRSPESLGSPLYLMDT